MQAMPSNILTILALCIGFLGLLSALWALWMVRSLNKLKTTFFAGTTGRDLETVIQDLVSGLHTLQENQVILEKHLKNFRNDFGLSVQKLGIVKFNPFVGGSGNLSFSLALLDGYNTGIILTSMHGREQNRVYTKQVVNGKCEIQLTEEELKAIELAENYYKKLISK